MSVSEPGQKVEEPKLAMPQPADSATKLQEKDAPPGRGAVLASLRLGLAEKPASEGSESQSEKLPPIMLDKNNDASVQKGSSMIQAAFHNLDKLK